MDPAIGARIRNLRERAGLQAQELASQVDLDPTALSKIENGKRGVKTAELGRIAAALQVSPLALLDGESLLSNLPIAARSAGQSIMGAAYQRLLALTELHTVLHDAGIGRPNNTPVPPVTTGNWKTQAGDLAIWARTILEPDVPGDGRFRNLAELIETQLGVDVLVEEYPNDPLSGAAITDREFPLLFVNAQHSTSRCLFTLAHELGHLLAGHENGISLDRELSGSDDSERMANAFAAEFLMPEARIREYLDTYGRGAESLLRMIHDLGVSFESLVYRLHNLRIVDAAGRDNLRQLGWGRLLAAAGEPDIAERLGSETVTRLVSRVSARPAKRGPVWLTRRCFNGYRQGAVSVRPLASLLDVDPEQLPADLAQAERQVAAFESPPAADTPSNTTDEELYAAPAV